MKKILFFVSALAGVLFAGSCQREELMPENAGANVVTFEVSVPEVATKALGDDVSNIDNLVYDVYATDEPLSPIPSAGDLTLLYKGTKPVTTGATTISVELVNDKNYVILFWAQRGNTWGVATEGTLLKNGVTFPDSWNANDETIEAFSGVEFISMNNLSAKTKKVTLKRPFAQLNIGTTLPNPENFTVAIEGTSVTVKNAGTSFNLIKQVAEYNKDITFNKFNVPGGNLTVNSINYEYAAMNYIFANGNVEVDYEIFYETENLNGSVKNTISNVPVAANYRTNIVGKLLTSEAGYEITLDDFSTNTNSGNIEVITEGLVVNQNGDYEISTDNGLIYAINNLWVDENGVANPKTFYVYPSEYNITDDQIKDINVTSGTLKIIKDVPVLTRSIAGIVITGLSKPLIASVSEEATVVISGVTIQTSEDNDQQNGALIGENNGKVIIENCDVIDETGAPDTTTELIGENNGTVTEPEVEGEAGVVYDATQLAAAFADAEVDAIVLGADITLEDVLVFPEGRTATLDLKGYKLTIAGEDKVSTTYAINNHGTLTIKDSYGVGEVNSRGIYNGYVTEGDPITTAELTIEGGNFNAMGTNGGAAVYNYGKVVINGGKFQSNGGYGLNNQKSAVMTITSAIVRGGIYNSNGTVTITDSNIYQHLNGKHAIYNWAGSVTINSGEFDSVSRNELILADGQKASVTIIDGEFHKTGKSWLYGAATGKEISFEIKGGTHYGYVNEPEMSVDTFRPYGDNFVVTGGSYNFDANKWCHKDYKALKNEKTGMWDVVAKVYVAQIDEDNKYESIREAVNAVQYDETITLLCDVTFTEGENSNGTWYEGLYYEGDKSFTIDLDGHTITAGEKVNDYLFLFKNAGDKANEITFKNGTLEAAKYAYCALCTSTSSTQKITINTENLQIIGNNSNGAVCKIRTGAEFNVKAGTKIVGKDSYVGIECYAATTNIYEGAEIYQNGKSSYAGSLVGVSANGTVNVYGGKGTSAQGGFIAMTSGGTININGGEWIANTDGTYANSNKSVLIAQSQKGAKCTINVTGGTFKGGYNCYGDAAGDAQIKISGGIFNADPHNYVVDGHFVFKQNGTWTVSKAPVENANVYELASAADLFWFANEVNSKENYFGGKTVKLADNIDLNNIEWTPIGSATADHGFMGNFDGNGKTIKNLNITDNSLTPDSDNYVYAGLFGVTEGTETQENYIKNLVIENVTIKTKGHIAAAAIAYPYYTTVENITVRGNINIKGGDYTSGALAYTRRCVNAKNISVTGNEGSRIEGNRTIGGVISDIQTNGGLIANYSDFSASGLTIKGVRNVGGISGIISSQTLNGATVRNVHIESEYTSVGIVSGAKGDNKSFVENVTSADVTGTDSVIGDSYGKDLKKVATADELVEALEANEGVYFLNDIKIDPANMSNAYGKTGINVKNGQTINGNGYTLNIKGAGGTWDSGINTTGGLIKNLTVTGSFRGIFINHNSTHSEKVVLEKVTITGTVYTISCDQGLYQGIEATDCTFNGWTSFAKTAGEAKFINCSFGEGSGNKYCRPYSNTEFVNCTFCPGYAVDATQATVTFTNCTWEE